MTVTNFKYDRYCTLEEGLTKLLKSKGYRLNIRYSQIDKAVVVEAVPIVNYSNDVEFSSDMRLNYLMEMQGDGVNHLICLGAGELSDRIVYHLYVDAAGNIGTTQSYFGIDEIAVVYDSPGASIDDLIVGGTDRIREMMNTNLFEIIVPPDVEIDIGDIVGGRDYLSGMLITAPITGKILRWEDGFRTTEYQFEDDVMAQITEE